MSGPNVVGQSSLVSDAGGVETNTEGGNGPRPIDLDASQHMEPTSKTQVVRLKSGSGWLEDYYVPK